MKERETDALDAICGDEEKENITNTGEEKHQTSEAFADADEKEEDAVSADDSDDDFFAAAKRRKAENAKGRIFEKYKIKDIVFLAVMAAITLLTSAVMMLVVPLLTTVFGIAQLVTGLQLSVFPAIAVAKVRKVGCMFLTAIFTGVIQLFMSPAMFVNNLVVGLILEVLVILIFRGYKTDKAVFFAVALYNPLSLPFNYIYNKIINDVGMTAVAEKAPWSAVGMTVAVCAVAVVGTLIGLRIAKELKKAGVLKK